MIGKRFLNSKKKKNENTKKRRLHFNRTSFKKFKHTGPDEFYGLAELLPIEEMCTLEELKEKKNEFITSITLCKYQRDILEVDTREQSSSSKWFTERRNRLTASDFGKICKMRETTSCKNTVYNKLYNSSGNVNEPQACKYGKNMESLAIKYFENKIGVQVNRCGLFIDKLYPYLGASPGKPTVILISIIHCLKYI